MSNHDQDADIYPAARFFARRLERRGFLPPQDLERPPRELERFPRDLERLPHDLERPRDLERFPRDFDADRDRDLFPRDFFAQLFERDLRANINGNKSRYEIRTVGFGWPLWLMYLDLLRFFPFPFDFDRELENREMGIAWVFLHPKKKLISYLASSSFFTTIFYYYC